MTALLSFRRCLTLLLLVLVGILTPLVNFTRPAAAASISPYDLIAAVNGLRAARGQAPLEVNSSLMAAAQAHSNYQASIRSGTHTGLGGTHPLDRARAAGYGGGAHIAVAENITSRRDNTPDLLSKAVYQDWSDDLHMNTMVNTGLQHIGAGVAEANGILYLTVDTGWVAGPASPPRTVNGTPPTPGPVLTQGPRPTSIPIVALVTSTPRLDGAVVHTVGYGQVLVNIASAYGVKPAEIAAWNNITPDAIYAGQRLLVRLPSTKTPVGFQASHTPTAMASRSPSASPTQPALPTGLTSTPTSAALAAALSASLPPEPVNTALSAPILATSTISPPAAPVQQTSSTETAILVTIFCGILGVILVSLRRK